MSYIVETHVVVGYDTPVVAGCVVDVRGSIQRIHKEDIVLLHDDMDKYTPFVKEEYDNITPHEWDYIYDDLMDNLE